MTMTPVEKTRLTAAEYALWVDAPENADRLFELIEGELVEKMPSYTSSVLGIRIAFFLMGYLTQHPLGEVTGADGGYRLSPDTVVIPDVGYISTARLPETPEREVPVAPDLAVEVRFPTDRVRALRHKAELYLAHGTPMVWLVFPETQTVEVYTPDADVTTLASDGVLDGGSVLPGFTLRLSDLFTY